MAYIGFDTSNYTTSVAAYFPEENRILQLKRLLPVKEGEKGLRQSDAVFHHTVQLHSLTDELFKDNNITVDGICASAYPRAVDGSYMPCFLVGLNTAKVLGSVLKKEVKTTSHQNGHILAALYSAGKLELINERFIAFHVSGGTTEALLVEPDEKEVIKCTLVASSLDLKAGQAVDRVGVMLGLKFPCGAEMDVLAQNSTGKIQKAKPFSNGADVSFSGLQNKCEKMYKDGCCKEDICAFCFEYIASALQIMTEKIIENYGDLPLLYSGGVMSNSIIRSKFEKKYGALFADAQFSADNAAGVAILAYLKSASEENQIK